MDSRSLNYPFLLIFFVSFLAVSNAHYFNVTSQSKPLLGEFLNPEARFLIAGGLSSVAAAISSAGGIGGGGLFVPILTIIAGLDVKTATSYSAFMVTGGSIANVACYSLAGTKGRINYDIALLSEPSMLLGVSGGVILNVVLPEWLITVLFVVFIAFCTFKTCKSGVLFWNLETERRMMMMNGESTKVPLLGERREEGKSGFSWVKIGILVTIWISFFLLYLLRGNSYGQGIIPIEVCGKAYWIISLMQIPLAIIFTTWILFHQSGPKNHDASIHDSDGHQPSRNLIFPVMALFAGLLGGVFGIGGGMLISPLLLQIGIPPEVTAATSSFMVFFSSAMSAIQYLLLGMEKINGALGLAGVCLVASLIGLTVVQKAVAKYGRASLIVFSVGTVMALSTVFMATFGAIETWRDYTNGKSMGFNKPC